MVRTDDKIWLCLTKVGILHSVRLEKFFHFFSRAS